MVQVAQRKHESADIGSMLSRMTRALVRRAGEGDKEALEVLVSLQRETADQVAAAGSALVAFGYSYADLANVLGISRQAARERFQRPGLPTWAGCVVDE